MGIREELLKMEKQFSKLYERATGVHPDYKTYGFFKNLKDGDLYSYVKWLYSGASKTEAKSGKARREWYKKHSYSPLVFLNSRIDDLDLNDRLFIEQLQPGEIVNRFDICAIAEDYNQQIGMYQAEDRIGNTIALCVSTPHNAKHYDDHWIDKPKSYYYNMQDEHDKSAGLFFKKKVNKLLFKDFEESSISDHPKIPIYLFVHEPGLKKKTFRFKGAYYVNSLPSLEAFEFVKGDLPMTKKLRNSKKRSLKRISKAKLDELVGERKITHMHKFSPSNYAESLIGGDGYIDASVFKSRYQEKHDYIEKQKLDSKIGSIGEELALKYEIEYVSKNIPGKEGDVKLAADSMGYDIRSFRKIGGNVVEIQIEVKTTSDENPYVGFNMSDHEKWYMENHPNTYWLYRIYDVYSNNIHGIYLNRDVAKHIAMKPTDYRCILK